MTLIVIGPVTKDLIIRKDKKEFKPGGACYFQSFVFEEFYPDYLTLINAGDEDMLNNFPNPEKVKLIEKDNTHYFINEYPYGSDYRIQSSNFANIPITRNDLENILPDNIDAFVINPLNSYDFPIETLEYLKSFDVPIYLSIQGFLRYPSKKLGQNYSIKLKLTPQIKKILSGIDALFLDENEASILFEEYGIEDLNINEIIITNGSKGSRVIIDKEIKIKAIKCENIVDSTGCGDTYMAAYISKKLTGKSILKSANFASKIASDKLNFFGPFKSDI